MNKPALQKAAEAIRAIDSFTTLTWLELRTKGNNDIDQARKSLINFIFSNGFELQEHTSKLIKSKIKRPLIILRKILPYIAYNYLGEKSVCFILIAIALSIAGFY